jgi:SpoVK/Ycf46/Vps4 family AAA+-type ATPase
LTTNARHHIDPAFLRRFAAVVHFPEPSELERHRLWDLLLGSCATRADSLDLNRLAREASVTGGEIAAVVVDAATEAASAGEPIDQERIDAAIARLQQRRGR